MWTKVKAVIGAVAMAASALSAAQSDDNLPYRQTPAGPAEPLSWSSMVCAGTPYVCNRLEAKGLLFAQPSQSKIVLISHGSQGIDARMFDYVKSLREAGFAALVVDHWTPRGVGVTHDNYVAAAAKGGTELNEAFDSLAAAELLRAKGFTKIGSIGESQGGAAAILLVQKWVHEFTDRNMTRLYSKPFKAQPLDAVVGMYGYCGFRNANRDGYVGTPFLFITGEVDDETPSRYCERYVPYMNERGGNAKIVVLEGEGHSFDAPYKRQRNNFGPHYAKCDILIEGSTVKELNSGETMAGTDSAPMFAKCKSTIYHSGYWKGRFVAVPHWVGFFKQNL